MSGGGVCVSTAVSLQMSLCELRVNLLHRDDINILDNKPNTLTDIFTVYLGSSLDFVTSRQSETHFHDSVTFTVQIMNCDRDSIQR